MRLRNVLLTSCGAAAVFFSTAAAEASGFATARFGGEHGHPTTDNPTALYYNPAGIAEDAPEHADLKMGQKFWRLKLFVDANLALRWASFSHGRSQFDEEEPAGAEGANVGEANLFNVVTAPAAGATFQIENFAFGLGFFVPLGGASSWDKNEKFVGNNQFAGIEDGVQRWHAIDGSLRSIYLTAGAAYDILDRVSIGATLNVIRSEVKTVRARTATSNNNINNEGRSLIDVGGWNASFGLGVIGEVEEDKVWIGFSYQAQPGLGQMDMEGTLTNNFGNISVADVKLLQSLPDIYRLGVRARPIKTVEVRFFGDFTNWGVFDSQCVVPAVTENCNVDENGAGFDNGAADPAPLLNLVRNWGPAFGMRAGGSYWVVPSTELYLGAGYDSNAVPDSTLEPALTDFQKASLTAGFRLTFGEIFAGALSYTHLFYVPRETQDECQDGLCPTDSILPAQQSPSISPDSGGRYTQTIGVINANVQLSF